MLTQKRAKELFDYCTESGVIRWRDNPIKPHKNGTIADVEHVHKEDGRKEKRVYVNECKKQFLSHRIAWLIVYGTWPKHTIDHKDRNPLNNAICNLRDVPQGTNNKNRPRQKNNTSGVVGVRWHKRDQRWQVECTRNNYIGQFKCLLDAVAARKRAEKRHLVTGY